MAVLSGEMEALMAVKWPIVVSGWKRELQMRKKKGAFHILTLCYIITDEFFIGNELSVY